MANDFHDFLGSPSKKRIYHLPWRKPPNVVVTCPQRPPRARLAGSGGGFVSSRHFDHPLRLPLLQLHRMGDAKPLPSGLVNRLFPHLTPGKSIKHTPSESSESDQGSRTPSVNLSASGCEPGSFAYQLHESDSASSLGSLADKVAEFVVPERVPEKIPHKATGELSLLKRREVRRLFACCFWLGLSRSSLDGASPSPPHAHLVPRKACYIPCRTTPPFAFQRPAPLPRLPPHPVSSQKEN